MPPAAEVEDQVLPCEKQRPGHQLAPVRPSLNRDKPVGPDPLRSAPPASHSLKRKKAAPLPRNVVGLRGGCQLPGICPTPSPGFPRCREPLCRSTLYGVSCHACLFAWLQLIRHTTLTIFSQLRSFLWVIGTFPQLRLAPAGHHLIYFNRTVLSPAHEVSRNA